MDLVTRLDAASKLLDQMATNVLQMKDDPASQEDFNKTL